MNYPEYNKPQVGDVKTTTNCTDSERIWIVMDDVDEDKEFHILCMNKEKHENQFSTTACNSDISSWSLDGSR